MKMAQLSIRRHSVQEEIQQMYIPLRMQLNQFYNEFARNLQFIITLLLHDPADQGLLRYRRALLTTLSSWVVKGIVGSVNLISIPLAAHYLGLERYGVWLVVSSVIGWLSLTDIGLSAHLTTLLAESSGRDDRESAQIYTMATLLALSTIALTFGCIASVTWLYTPWVYLFNVKDATAQMETPLVVGVVIMVTLLSLPFSISNNIHFGYQEGWKVSLWQGAASISRLPVLLIVVHRQLGLPALAFALGGVPVLIMGLNLLTIMIHGRPWLFTWPKQVHFQQIKTIMRGSFWMFIANLQSIFWIGKDNLLISRLLGPKEVGPFDLTFTIYFTLLNLLVIPIAMSFWPAYTEAMARNDWKWVKKTFNHTLSVTILLYSMIVVVIAIFAQPIIYLWAGKALVPIKSLPFALSAEFILIAWTNITGLLLVAAKKTHIAGLTGLLAGFTSVGLSILFAKQWGLTGIVLGNTIALTFFMAIPLHLIAMRTIKNKIGLS